MKNNLTFAFLLVTALVCAQKRSTIALTYGTNVYSKPFNGQLNTLDSFQIGSPTQYIGFGGNGHFMTNGNVEWAGHFMLAKYLPQQINLNDSVMAELSGFSFGWGYGFDCFNNAANIDFILSGGLNFGRVKLTQAENSVTGEEVDLSVKNMFISPKASAMLILYVKSVAISLNAEYAYDLSASRWKQKIIGRETGTVEVPKFNQSGLGFSIGLGWAL